jgi:hypothetical protein
MGRYTAFWTGGLPEHSRRRRSYNGAYRPSRGYPDGGGSGDGGLVLLLVDEPLKVSLLGRQEPDPSLRRSTGVPISGGLSSLPLARPNHRPNPDRQLLAKFGRLLPDDVIVLPRA